MTEEKLEAFAQKVITDDLSRALGRSVLGIMGRESTIEARHQLVTAFGWLDAAREIEQVDAALLVDGKFGPRIRDTAGDPHELLLPTSPSNRVAIRSEQKKAEGQDHCIISELEPVLNRNDGACFGQYGERETETIQ